MPRHARDHLVQFRMQQRFATGEGDDYRPQIGKMIDVTFQQPGFDGRGDLVVLVAITAAQVALAGDDHLGQDRP